MTTTKDGGQAFSTLGYEKQPPGTKIVLCGGMSLRDYFAAKAMQGMAANPSFVNEDLKDMANLAYETANIMIAERER